MQEVKFGYRQNVQKDAKKRKGLGDVKGTADALGGVYGFFKDESDSAMMVFSGKVYAENKEETEHCGDKYLLIEANHPDRKASNIVCDEFVTEEQMLKCEFKDIDFDLIQESTHNGLKNLTTKILQCDKCVLGVNKGKRGRKTPFFIGDYSLMAIDNLPHDNPDLYNALADYGVEKDFVHFTSLAKCSSTKKSDSLDKPFETCSQLWLSREFLHVKPTVVLGIGAPVVNFFGEAGGIMELNGLTKWNAKYNCWVCYCISPYAMQKGGHDKTIFLEGIKNFADTIDRISNIISE